MFFFLAWLFLYDKSDYRTGLILTGNARCIAMVLLWNMLAGGDGEFCAVIVALNSIFQVVMYGPLSYFFLEIFPSWLNLETTSVNISIWEIAKSVLIFLGIPLVAGFITRFLLTKIKGYEWYDSKFIPKLGQTALIGLLFTIVVMFSMQGDQILKQPLQIIRISIPLLVYFAIMFGIAFGISIALKFPYEIAVTQSFTAASNNFELAIAVAVGTFGISSPVALAAVIGPLIEVPVLVGLVYVSLWLKKRFFIVQPPIMIQQ